MEFYKMNAKILPEVNFLDKTEIGPPYVHRKRKAHEQIMYVIKSGEMHLLEDGMPLNLTAGDVCILDGERTHEGVDATTCSYYYVHFKHEDMQLVSVEEDEEIYRKQYQRRKRDLSLYYVSYGGYDESIYYLPRHFNIPNVNDQVYLNELLERAILDDYSAYENHKVMVSLRLQEALIWISRWYITSMHDRIDGKVPVSRQCARELLEWMNRCYAEEITSTRIEKEFSCNFDYLNRVFKKMTGQTIFQRLTDIRIEHAKRLMEQSNMHSKVVGMRVGYPDEYYFSRVFKQHVGMSPTAYADSFMKDQKSRY